MTAVATNDLFRRHTYRKASRGLCEGKALLGDHTVRLKLASRAAESEFDQS